MSTETFSYDIGTITRDIGAIAGALGEIADQVTGRRPPDAPTSPRPFAPREDDDTFPRLLAILLGLVGNEVSVEWQMTHHPSVAAQGVLEVDGQGENGCNIGCRLDDSVGFWLDRHEVFDVETFKCGCASLLTVGGHILVGGSGCRHGVEEDDR